MLGCLDINLINTLCISELPKLLLPVKASDLYGYLFSVFVGWLVGFFFSREIQLDVMRAVPFPSLGSCG